MVSRSMMGARTTNTASETKAFRGGTVAPLVSVQRCVAPHNALHQNELRPSDVSSARITPCTRASCDGASSQVPLGPGQLEVMSLHVRPRCTGDRYQE